MWSAMPAIVSASAAFSSSPKPGTPKDYKPVNTNQRVVVFCAVSACKAPGSEAARLATSAIVRVAAPPGR